MRIGVDTRELTGRVTGVGRYVGELLAALVRPRIGCGWPPRVRALRPVSLPAAVTARIERLRARVASSRGAEAHCGNS